MSEVAGEATETYSPIDRVEERSQRLPELASIGVAVAGFVLQGGLAGVAAGVVLVALWTRLRTEFVFAAGVLLFVSIGGSFSASPSVLALIGLAGLLAVDIARAWESMRPVVVFLCLFVVGSVLVVYASGRVALHWVGLGVVVSLSVASYALHRYDVVRFGTVDDVPPDSDPNREGSSLAGVTEGDDDAARGDGGEA